MYVPVCKLHFNINIIFISIINYFKTCLIIDFYLRILSSPTLYCSPQSITHMAFGFGHHLLALSFIYKLLENISLIVIETFYICIVDYFNYLVYICTIINHEIRRSS